MADCIFCKILAGEIPASKVYEDDQILAFEDISAKAPVHILIIPKEHVDTLNDAGPEHEALIGRIVLKAAELAWEKGISQSGYRVLANCNRDAGQEVFHLHFHLLGGHRLKGLG